jgi:hypothetical protein
MDWLDENLYLMEPINYTLIDGNDVDLSKNNIFRATMQELIGSMVYVIFFLTQTEEGFKLSRE